MEQTPNIGEQDDDAVSPYRLGIRCRQRAEGRDRLQEQTPLPCGPCKRYQSYGQPTGISASVVHLLSPAASFITGSEMVIDGGLMAG